MKLFLTYSSVIEGLIGVSFFLFPTRFILLMFETPLNSNAGKIFSMIAGATIFAIALICWLLRKESSGIIAVKLLLFYNISFTAVLIYGVVRGLTGTGLWVLIGFHAFQIIMSLMVLLKNNALNKKSA